jgi:aminopeptidase
MNRGIDRVTDNILFDEKMGGTVHMALGRAYGSNFPEGHEDEQNESAVHVDLIRWMDEGSLLAIDGETVQEDGVFVWE